MSVPSYRERLRLEGSALAGLGATSAVLVVALAEDATRGPLSTVVQLAIVAGLMATLGTRSVRRAMDAATEHDADIPGSGEPTPLWHLAVVVAGLTLGFGLGAGWDAALRVGGGCVIVGLAQALLFERQVAAVEVQSGRRFFRVPGSSLFTGTRLASVREP